MNDYIKILNNRRKARGLSIEQVAELSGVNKATVSRFFNGSDAKLSTFDSVAKSLDFQISISETKDCAAATFLKEGLVKCEDLKKILLLVDELEKMTGSKLEPDEKADIILKSVHRSANSETTLSNDGAS